MVKNVTGVGNIWPVWVYALIARAYVNGVYRLLGLDPRALKNALFRSSHCGLGYCC
jgi:hypothetical protein